MTRSVAIIGAGQIGYAAACVFRARGWDVTVHARSQPRWHDASLWRFERFLRGETDAPSANVVLDTIAFDTEDVELYDADRIGRLIVVSSASVYCDAEGRTLDEATLNGFPEFGGPITENQSTVAPGPQTYSTRKVSVERRAIDLFGDRATILRPCAIYGAHSRHPREWWFVKRFLDGRKRVPLIHGGRSQFQPTNVEDIGYFSVDAAEKALGGIYNIADDGCPSVLEIGDALRHQFEFEPELVPIETNGLAGRTPWSVDKPFLVANGKMKAASYHLPSTYGQGVQTAAAWLCELNPADWRASFPQLAAYPWDLFDYEAEDAYFASR